MVAIAAAAVDEVIGIAREIESRELAIVTEALGGATIAEARAKHGYHVLQRHDQ